MSGGAIVPVLLAEDVAEMLGCSLASVHEWSARGEIPHRRLPGKRRLFFDADELRVWLDGAELEVRRLARGGRVVKPKPRRTT